VIINKYSNAMAQAVERPDGSVEIVIEQMEGRMDERAKRGRGPLVKTMGGREPNSLIG
jgi:hypothetical protein